MGEEELSLFSANMGSKSQRTFCQCFNKHGFFLFLCHIFVPFFFCFIFVTEFSQINFNCLLFNFYYWDLLNFSLHFLAEIIIIFRKKIVACVESISLKKQVFFNGCDDVFINGHNLSPFYFISVYFAYVPYYSVFKKGFYRLALTAYYSVLKGKNYFFPLFLSSFRILCPIGGIALPIIIWAKSSQTIMVSLPLL